MKHLTLKLTTLALIAAMALGACSSTPAIVVTTDESQSAVTISTVPSVATSQTGTTTQSVVQTADPDVSLIETHESENDYAWNEEDVVEIALLDSASSAASQAVKIEGNLITITASGTYRLTGTLSDGQVLVDAADDGTVRLILNGVNIHSSTSAPVYIKSAEKTVVILADGTQNKLSDTANYVFESAEEDEPNATLFSNDNLTVYGSGELSIVANYNDAINSDDGVLIYGANITIAAVDDGIRGKDYLVVRDASLEITAGGDGMKSDNDSAEALGQIQIVNSIVAIDSAGDAISAEGAVAISSGEFSLKTANASFNAETTSAKGIKGLVSVVLDGGSFAINSVDDAIHSNGDISINGGSFTISSGDDGIHADNALTINGGTIDITKSYEGLEALLITLNGGSISIVASDDGINAAGGVDGSGLNGGWGTPGGQAPWAQAEVAGNQMVYFNGAEVYINAGGDGIDSNGSIEMNAGVVLVDGPTNDANGPLDYMGTFNINGGTFVAVGSLGMAQSPSTTSTQPSIFIGLNQTLSASTLIHVQTTSGQDVLTYSPSKTFQSVLISSPELQLGETYVLYTGGSISGEIQNNLVINGQYQQGTQLTQLTLSSSVTTYGSYTPGFGGGGLQGGGGGIPGGGIPGGGAPGGGVPGGGAPGGGGGQMP